MHELILDIETIPDDTLPDELRPEASYGNLKDPVKIATKKAEWEENGLIKKMSVSPFMCKIVSIQAWSSIKQGYISPESHEEADMITFIDKAIEEHQLIIGHNLIGFDLQVINARAMITGHDSKDGIFKIGKAKRYSNNPFYDTMQVLAGWEKDKWKGLDWWCQRLGLGGKTNHGSAVYQMYCDDKRDEIDAYCLDDVKATKALYDRIKPYYAYYK